MKSIQIIKVKEGLPLMRDTYSAGELIYMLSAGKLKTTVDCCGVGFILTTYMNGKVWGKYLMRGNTTKMASLRRIQNYFIKHVAN